MGRHENRLEIFFQVSKTPPILAAISHAAEWKSPGSFSVAALKIVGFLTTKMLLNVWHKAAKTASIKESKMMVDASKNSSECATVSLFDAWGHGDMWRHVDEIPFSEPHRVALFVVAFIWKSIFLVLRSL